VQNLPDYTPRAQRIHNPTARDVAYNVIAWMEKETSLCSTTPSTTTRKRRAPASLVLVLEQGPTGDLASSCRYPTAPGAAVPAAADYKKMLTQKQLWALAESVKDSRPSVYVTYVIAEKLGRGITCLRTPIAHCELSPVELAWAQVRGHITKHNGRTGAWTMSDVRKLGEEGVDLVTADRWRAMCKHVEEGGGCLLAQEHRQALHHQPRGR